VTREQLEHLIHAAAVIVADGNAGVRCH